MIEITKTQPKFIPMMCPVCRGHQTVNYGKFICQACKGLGYIKVPPKEEGEEEYGENKR